MGSGMGAGGGAYAAGGIPGATYAGNAYGGSAYADGMTGTTLIANPGCGIGSGPSDAGCCVGGPETSCGGVGNACFEGAGNMVTTADWSYAVPQKQTIVTPYGCRIRPCCLLLLALLSLLGLALA